MDTFQEEQSFYPWDVLQFYPDLLNGMPFFAWVQGLVEQGDQ